MSHPILIGNAKFYHFEEFMKKVQDKFIEKLYKENQYRYNGLEEEQIDRLIKKTQQKLKNRKKLFQKCLQMREGSQNIQNLVLKQSLQKVKKEQSQSKNPQQKQSKTSCELCKDEQDDKISDFNWNELIKLEVEEQKSYHNEFNLKIHSEQVSESDNESEDSQDLLTPEYCLSNLNSIIVGNYSNKTMRYSSKISKNALSFENALIKTRKRDYFMDLLHIEVIKMDKGEVRLQLQIERDRSMMATNVQ